MKEDGTWEKNVERVKDVFTNGFDKLYRTDQIVCPNNPDQIPIWGNYLSESEAQNMAATPTDVEIFLALKSMKAFKAPGWLVYMLDFSRGFGWLWESQLNLKSDKFLEQRKFPKTSIRL